MPSVALKGISYDKNEFLCAISNHVDLKDPVCEILDEIPFGQSHRFKSLYIPEWYFYSFSPSPCASEILI